VRHIGADVVTAAWVSVVSVWSAIGWGPAFRKRSLADLRVGGVVLISLFLLLWVGIGVMMLRLVGQSELLDVYLVLGFVVGNTILPGLMILPWYLPQRVNRLLVKSAPRGSMPPRG
jgi:hypothetical protein